MKFSKRVIKFFDKLEDRVRGALSRRPIAYTFIGGVGIVLFWKGVWETAELFPFLFGPMSILASVIILLMTGLFVSFFIGDTILISGLKSQKKLTEKTEEEVKSEEEKMEHIRIAIKKIEKDVEEIKKEIMKYGRK